MGSVNSPALLVVELVAAGHRLAAAQGLLVGCPAERRPGGRGRRVRGRTRPDVPGGRREAPAGTVVGGGG